MKNTQLFLALVILIITIQCYSQNSNEFRIYYGFSESELLRNQDLDGTGSTNLNNFSEFGVRYLRQIKNNFSIELGLNYLNVEESITSAPADFPITRFENIEIISIPIYANYTFWKYLFVNGGPIIDFQISDNSSDSQAGIGYSLGFGGKYDFDNFLIFINPNYKRHAVMPFEKENYYQKLTELGIQIGLGYKF